MSATPFLLQTPGTSKIPLNAILPAIHSIVKDSKVEDCVEKIGGSNQERLAKVLEEMKTKSTSLLKDTWDLAGNIYCHILISLNQLYQKLVKTV